MGDRDKVQVDYIVTGAQEGAKQIDALGESIDSTGTASKAAAEDLSELTQGLGVLGPIAGWASPRLGLLVRVMTALKVASNGLRAGLINVAKAGRALIVSVFANPILLGAAVVIGGLALAFSRMASAAEEAAQKAEEAREALRKYREERDAVFNARQESGAQAVQAAETTLIAAGADNLDARKFVKSYIDAAKEAQVPVAVARTVAEDLAKELHRAPTTAQIAGAAGVRAILPDTPVLQAAILAQNELVQKQLKVRADTLAASPGGSETVRAVAADVERAAKELQSVSEPTAAIPGGELPYYAAAKAAERLDAKQEEIDKRIREVKELRRDILTAGGSFAPSGFMGASFYDPEFALDKQSRQEIRQLQNESALIQARAESLRDFAQGVGSRPELLTPAIVEMFGRDPTGGTGSRVTVVNGNVYFAAPQTPPGRGMVPNAN